MKTIMKIEIALLVIVVLVCLYGVRLMTMQVVDGEMYAQLAKQRNSYQQNSASRLHAMVRTAVTSVFLWMQVRHMLIWLTMLV